jgi:polyhydroxyalkanoate synthesis regulator phasin
MQKECMLPNCRAKHLQCANFYCIVIKKDQGMGMIENKGKIFEEEYKELARKLIYIIENAKFGRERKGGYNTDQTDDFLDNLMLEIDKHSRYENIGSLINTNSIADVLFDTEKNGYNMGELDDFLDILEMEVEQLNAIKLKYV